MTHIDPATWSVLLYALTLMKTTNPSCTKKDSQNGLGEWVSASMRTAAVRLRNKSSESVKLELPRLERLHVGKPAGSADTKNDLRSSAGDRDAKYPLRNTAAMERPERSSPVKT